jgi:quinoprotein glucose dehydrogenase
MARLRLWHVLLGLAVVAGVWPHPGSGQGRGGGPSGPQAAGRPAEWRNYGNDEKSTRYSPLDQINRDTVKNLQIAWTWKFDNFGTPAETITTETTPIMVNGVLYFTAGQRRTVVAANAATGETLWTWRPEEGERFDRAPRKVHRGVTYWADNRGEGRILVVTPGFQLVSLDAKTGVPNPGFGEDGIVDLFKQVDDKRFADLTGALGNSSPPVIINDTVIVGPAMLVGTRVNKANPKADIMAFDVRTGKKRWVFHSVPRKGEPGYETWENGSADYTGNAGIWGPFSADPELGLVYLPIETPTNDVYGGHRPGDNLYGNTLVAVEARSGKKVWHQQLIHHDIWDYDMPAHPILIDITVDGQRIPVVVQLTKQAFAYVFDRRTGKPVWPMEERPVPQSDAPGEKTAKTQPFPTRPPAFDVQGISHDDLIDFTPELRAEAIKAIANYRIGPLYTPPSLVTPTNRGTIVVPGFGGGANWQSGAADPETGFVYVPSVTNPAVIGLNKNDPAQTKLDSDYTMGGGAPQLGGLRLLKPPYGRITAYDMNKGDIAWMIPNGDTPPAIKNHERLKGLNIPRTGSPSQAGLLVTKTLLLAGEGSAGQPIFHAYDKATGQEIWQAPLPGPQVSLPMTYLHQGRQFVVMGVRGTANSGAQLVAFAIPQQQPAGGRGRGAGGGQRGAGDGPQ